MSIKKIKKIKLNKLYGKKIILFKAIELSIRSFETTGGPFGCVISFRK